MIAISVSDVKKWIKIYKTLGSEGLIIKKRGVKKGTNRKLTYKEAKFKKKTIMNTTFKKIGLNYYLWTRRSI